MPEVSIERIRETTRHVGESPVSTDLISWFVLADDPRSPLRVHTLDIPPLERVALDYRLEEHRRQSVWFTMTPSRVRLGSDGRPLTKLLIGTPHWQETDSSVGLLREATFLSMHPDVFESQGVRYVFRPHAHAFGHARNSSNAAFRNQAFIEDVLATVRPPTLALNPAVSYPLRYQAPNMTSLDWRTPHPSAALNMMLLKAYSPHLVLDGHAFPIADGALAQIRFTEPDVIDAFHLMMARLGAPLSQAPSEFLHVLPVARGIIPAVRIWDVFEAARRSNEDMPAHWKGGGMMTDYLASMPGLRRTQYISPENPKWVMTKIPSLPRPMTQWDSVQMAGRRLAREILPLRRRLMTAIYKATSQGSFYFGPDFALFKDGCKALIEDICRSGETDESISVYVAHSPAGALQAPATDQTHAANYWGGEGLTGSCVNLAQVLHLIDPTRMRKSKIASDLTMAIVTILEEVQKACAPVRVDQEELSIRQMAPGIAEFDRLLASTPERWVAAPEEVGLTWKEFANVLGISEADSALVMC
jgi:hypothetical protein